MSSNKSVLLLPTLSLPFLLAALSLASTVASAAENTLTCPEKIAAVSTLANPPPGWKTTTDARPNPFSRISMTSGPPEEEAFLAPDSDTKTAMTWQVPAKQQYWVVCHYHHSSLRLTQQIPANAKQCTLQIKSAGSKATQHDNKLVCQ